MVDATSTEKKDYQILAGQAKKIIEDWKSGMAVYMDPQETSAIGPLKAAIGRLRGIEEGALTEGQPDILTFLIEASRHVRSKREVPNMGGAGISVNHTKMLPLQGMFSILLKNLLLPR